MKVFDTYMDKTLRLLSGCPVLPIPAEGDLWPLEERMSFLMEKDTAVELGGYPKESVNLIISSSGIELGQKGQVGIIGDPGLPRGGRPRLFGGSVREGEHLSYGKIVLLKVGGIEEDAVYDYVQSIQVADIRLRFRDVMTRTSSEQFHTNLRISQKAMADGFTLERMGRAILRHFLAVPRVEQAKVILLVGESPLYKELLPIAEDVKRISAALNTMFDGIDLDCAGCGLSSICEEVEGLRELHMAARKPSLNS